MRLLVIGSVMLCAWSTASGEAPYPRAGWSAELSTVAHGVSGTVTIVDQDTFRLDDFFYDGGGISVYVYLAADDSHDSFVAGLETGPQLLGTPFSGGSLVIDLPPGQTMDGYNAVSIWCVTASSSFGSGTFGPPAYPRSGYSATLPLGSHSTRGTATIVNERTIRLDNFYYDGFAPAVYVNLGVDSSNASFASGTWIGPQLVRAYNDESLTVQFPTGMTVSGFGAICIWCEVITACFTRADFPRTAADLDIDGDVDAGDVALSSTCMLGPADPPPDTQPCRDADLNADGRVDLRDFAGAVLCFSGKDHRPTVGCIE